MNVQLVVELIITISKTTKKKCKLMVTDLNKQEALDGNPKAVQQIDFTINLNQSGNAMLFFVIKDVKQITLDFLQM